MSGATANPTAEKPRKRAANLPHLATRIFDTPLLITREKAEVILSVLAPRLEIKAPLVEFDADDALEVDRAPYEVVDGIAVIAATGTLLNKAGAMDALSGLTSYQQLAQDLDRALADPAVKGILFDVDSPGGESAGCFELVDKIHAARAVKPIYAVANPMAASGGYALASAASKVFAPEVSYTGSIGVYTVHVDRSKALDEAGIAVSYIFAGDRKIDGASEVPLSAEARAAIQDRIDGIYGVFVASVARNRGLDEKDVRATQGGVFLGAKALEAGLIDQIGGRDDALGALRAELKEKAMLKELELRVATLTTERDAALAKIAAFERAQAERDKAEDKAFVERLQAESAECQAPVAATDVALVQDRFAKGDRVGARALGDAFLRAAKASGGTKTGGTAPIAPPKSKHEEAVAQGAKALADAAGFDKPKAKSHAKPARRARARAGEE